MKRPVLFVAVLTVLFVGALVALFVGLPRVALSVLPLREHIPTPFELPEATQTATVNYVHDGDTLFLSTPDDANLKVRLLAVDTPEVGDNLECYGDEATAYLRELAPEGSKVYTLADAEQYDQYGRALLFVWTSSGELINASLVANGYAEAVFIGSNRLYEDKIEAAEDDAQAASLGMWGAC